jgi:hypothetical protein
MATKYGPRKKHNAGTVRTSTNTQGGSRTRKTTTVKTGNFTRSRSVNRNGTVRLTTTHKSPSGFITRSVSTVGSKPSKPKAPKFIKSKPFKAPKMKTFKAPRIRTTMSSGRRGRSSSSGDSMILLLVVGIFAGLFSLIAWIFKTIFSLVSNNKNETEEVEFDDMQDNDKALFTYLYSITDDQAKILFYDTLGIWINANNITEDDKEKIKSFDWVNFNFEEWKVENGYQDEIKES